MKEWIPVGADVDEVGDGVVDGLGPQLDGDHVGLLALLQRSDLVLQAQSLYWRGERDREPSGLGGASVRCE